LYEREGEEFPDLAFSLKSAVKTNPLSGTFLSFNKTTMVLKTKWDKCKKFENSSSLKKETKA